MNPINFALRRPKSVMVLLITVIMIGLSVIRPNSVDTLLREQGG